MTMGLEQARPVVRAGAGLRADHAGRQRGDQRVQLGARDAGLAQFGSAGLVDSVHGENILGEIDANAQNAHDFPLRMC